VLDGNLTAKLSWSIVAIDSAQTLLLLYECDFL
jgi:hypothetical protein